VGDGEGPRISYRQLVARLLRELCLPNPAMPWKAPPPFCAAAKVFDTGQGLATAGPFLLAIGKLAS
jgi:hypothetical protein